MDDQEVVIVDDKGTEHVFPAGFNPRHAIAIVRNGGSSALPTKPASTEDFMAPRSGVLQTAKDVAVGGLKGVAHTAMDIAQTAAHSRMLPGITPESLPDMAIDKGREATAYGNNAQRVGGALETAAEIALPMVKGASAVPRISRAARTLETVMQAAKDAPVDVAKAGDVALRIQQLADRGGTMPRTVGKFVQRVTDPNQAGLTYGEGRDFYSNISRLSANEFQRLTPVIQREVGNMRVALNDGLSRAAQTVGQGENYANAMKEYAQAAKLGDVVGAVGEGAKKALPYAGGAGLGYLAMKKLIAALGG
jgi:hypothetical protein